MEGGCIREAQDVIREIQSYAAMWEEGGGGVTFSGGEPLLQKEFLTEVLEGLRGIPAAVETSAAVPGDLFQSIIKKVDHVYVDLKIFEEKLHVQYTGCSNRQILENICWLAQTEIPCTIRIPMIPQVSATEKNYKETAAFLKGLARKLPVELLPYNTMAKAKYDKLGYPYNIRFDPEAPAEQNLIPFQKEHILCRIL